MSTETNTVGQMLQRAFRLFAVMSFSALIWISPASGADFPNRPVVLIAPTAPGGAMDTVARLLADRLGARLGQPIVIDYKPGVGGTLGVGQAARAPADGHTLVIVADSYLTVAPRLLKGVNLQPMRDLAPVIEIGTSPMVLVAHPSLKVKTVADYIDRAKLDAGKLTYASGGSGSPHHLFMGLLEQQLGLRLTHVPYKGGPQAFSDVLAGHTQSMFIAISTANSQISSGKLEVLGVSSAKRMVDYPAIPAIAETVPGYESEYWFALFAPRNVPPPVIARLNREVSAILDEPEVARALKGMGFLPTTTRTPEALAQKLEREDSRMAKLIEQMRLKAE